MLPLETPTITLPIIILDSHKLLEFSDSRKTITGTIFTGAALRCVSPSSVRLLNTLNNEFVVLGDS